jgi:hypothetical protein
MTTAATATATLHLPSPKAWILIPFCLSFLLTCFFSFMDDEIL